jgi:LacI family transcriptional regulator
VVTQKEVAERAGVSFITVSRVINNQGNVAEGTRRRVLEAVRALNYHPNHLGQALNSGRNNTIGIVTPIRFEGGLSANLYLIGILDGIEKACRERRLDLHLSTESLSDSDSGFDFLRPWHQRKVDGVVFIGLQAMGEEQIREIQTRQVPCVAIADRPEGLSWIDTDNEGAGCETTARLISRGHRRIAFLGLRLGQFINQNIDDRRRGYVRALEAAGLPVRPEWQLEGDFSAESGRDAFQRLLELPGERPTALFCGNDDMALGAMQEALARGYKVPGDFAFVGFDAFPAGQYARPKLASNRQPLREMGHEAVCRLMAQIENSGGAADSLVMPIQFVDAGSASPDLA